MIKRKGIILLLVLSFLLMMTGCSEGRSQTDEGCDVSSVTQDTSVLVAESASERKLLFSVVEDDTLGFTLFSEEDLGGLKDISLTYYNLSEVNVTLDGVTISLTSAIGTEKLTIAEIFAYARMDTQKGFCQESFISKKGLTHFYYTYPECELRITYDVYETPNGGQTLINTLYIYNLSNANRDGTDYYVDETSEWGYFLDREDWGLNFDVISVSPTQITVNYTQCQGQEIGELTLDDFSLYARTEGNNLDTYMARSSRESEEFPIAIQSDSSGQITLDWSGVAGSLEPGEYYLKVTVSDNYDESDAHPLMINYYDRQSYHIVFTIE